MAVARTHREHDVPNLKSSIVAGEEATLLESARAGDPAAFESLVMPHWDALLRITLRIVRNREDAEDAVQSAVLDAFRNLNGFRGHSRFSSWLTRIAMNAALMRLRAIRRRRETSLDETTKVEAAQTKFHPVDTKPNPEQEYLSKEARDLLEKGLKRLAPLYSQVLQLNSLQELSAKEAAELLEVPVGTVKARLHRARVKLSRSTQSMLTPKRRRIATRRQGVGALVLLESARA